MYTICNVPQFYQLYKASHVYQVYHVCSLSAVSLKRGPRQALVGQLRRRMVEVRHDNVSRCRWPLIVPVDHDALDPSTARRCDQAGVDHLPWYILY
jgi:hypothetical protein